MDPDDGDVRGVLQVERLLRSVSVDPGAPRLVAVAGPGGSGKTLALRSLKRLYARTGQGPAGPSHDSVPLVVDDVHALDDHAVRRIVAEAHRPGAQVAVAFRPWPVERGLGELRELITQLGTTVHLEPLDRTQVAVRAQHRLGVQLDGAAVDSLTSRTGGLLCLVDAVLDCADGVDPQPWERPAALAAWDPVRRLAAVTDVELPVVRDVVLALALGACAEAGLLMTVLRQSPAVVIEALQHVRVSGLLSPDGTVVPAVREAVLATTLPARASAVLEAVLRGFEERGAPDLEIVGRTTGVTMHHPLLAALRTRAARSEVDRDPGRAARLFHDAVAAGADRRDLTVDLARSTALAGDVRTAARLADEALADSDGPRAAAAAEVLGAALAHEGLVGRSAAVYRPIADRGHAGAAQLWSLAALATGKGAGRLPDWPSSGRPPSLAEGSREAMVRGVQQSLDGDGTTALPTLLESAAMFRARGRGALLPDTPAALGALVALHCGAGALAESTLREAIASGLGGPVAQPRHRLLLAWVAMVDGRLEEAVQEAALAARAATGPANGRDELFARAIDLGVARRAHDLAGLVEAWPAALDTLVRRPADLFGLLPLGEIAVAAARLDEGPHVAPYLERAEALLDGLGRPVLWSAPHHWYGIQVAIVAERPDWLARHARALAAASPLSHYADVLTDAGRVWLHVLGARVDPPAVERAARRLVALGMSWDGARLVGHAAARTPDRASMVALLQLARSLRPAVEESRAPTARHPRPGDGVLAVAGAGVLSERELEVARLVVAGRTYRQIAERLYISPKTVEHHVARMRQRLDLRTRGELLAHLRGLLAQAS
ncbi:helix-turn-helix transcriptional regulator [Cellulomonas sp. URHE0023]|uniref:helix-turn-helix transcriptional regulator n=1 Tax=Cellulomonas sp. URHE0023 TaxID=1380354 RepID=UPI00068B9C97|nr:helix-turn-helix transcriptional regulator [Cellulomonas sp. URHE0023]